MSDLDDLAAVAYTARQSGPSFAPSYDSLKFWGGCCMGLGFLSVCGGAVTIIYGCMKVAELGPGSTPVERQIANFLVTIYVAAGVSSFTSGALLLAVGYLSQAVRDAARNSFR